MIKISALLLFLALPSFAQERPLDLAGLTPLIAEKIKEAKAATILTYSGEIGGGGYISLWTFHSANKDREYLELPNIGWRAIDGQKPAATLSMAINFPAISAALWDFEWAKAHVKRSPFPPIFMGPVFIVPFDPSAIEQIAISNWKNYLGFQFSIRLGSSQP